jgi:hypothetical protein
VEQAGLGCSARKGGGRNGRLGRKGEGREGRWWASLGNKRKRKFSFYPFRNLRMEFYREFGTTPKGIEMETPKGEFEMTFKQI